MLGSVVAGTPKASVSSQWRFPLWLPGVASLWQLGGISAKRFIWFWQKRSFKYSIFSLKHLVFQDFISKNLPPPRIIIFIPRNKWSWYLWCVLILVRYEKLFNYKLSLLRDQLKSDEIFLRLWDSLWDWNTRKVPSLERALSEWRWFQQGPIEATDRKPRA